MSARQHEAGFTLVELLVVLVIMPLVIGAIAAAIIISEQDSGVAGSRLTDSANAQTASEFYVRDVQGAQYVTTSGNAGAASFPPVCVNPALSNTLKPLGLYRPALANAPALSIGYWEVPGPTIQLVRDSCSVTTSGSTITSTYNNQVVISDEISEVSTTITPSNFATDAAYGWTPTTASTTVTTTTNLPAVGTAFPLPVASTSGLTGQQMSVRGSAGNLSMTCPAPQPPTNAFMNCTANGSGTITQGAVVSQPNSITEIGISVTEPGSDYTYSLQASPRTWASRTSGDAGPGAGTGAALVSLSDVTLSGDASLEVDGTVDINGSLDESGLTGAGLTSTGKVNTNTPATDPLGPFLPSSVTISGNTYSSGCTISTSLAQPLNPGEYTCQLVLQNGANVTLSPGVYQLDDGITVEDGARLSASGGVLLYLPCTGGCSETATFENGASVTLPPLNSAQALTASDNSGTGLEDVWFWQASNGNGTTLIGNGQGNQTAGIAYAPNAPIDLSNTSGSDATGEIVAQRITMEPASGSANFLVAGQ